MSQTLALECATSLLVLLMTIIRDGVNFDAGMCTDRALRRERERERRVGWVVEGPTMLVTSPMRDYESTWRWWRGVGERVLNVWGATWAYVIGWLLSEVGLSWLSDTHTTKTNTHLRTSAPLSAEQGRWCCTFIVLCKCAIDCRLGMMRWRALYGGEERDPQLGVLCVVVTSENRCGWSPLGLGHVQKWSLLRVMHLVRTLKT